MRTKVFKHKHVLIKITWNTTIDLTKKRLQFNSAWTFNFSILPVVKKTPFCTVIVGILQVWRNINFVSSAAQSRGGLWILKIHLFCWSSESSMFFCILSKIYLWCFFGHVDVVPSNFVGNTSWSCKTVWQMLPMPSWPDYQLCKLW